MNKTELIQKSIYIIVEYYKNNLQPYFDSITENVLWFGPRAGMMLMGKENILKAWEAESHNLTFSMGNIEAVSTSTGINNLEVMLEYYVYTHFPDGKTDCHHQRLHYSWGNRKDPKVYMIHIANIADEKEGGIYASSSADSAADAVSTWSSRSTVIYARGNQGITYYFSSLSILYIESTDSSRHSIVHATDGIYPTIEPLRYYEKHFSDVFLRAHAGYLVNPAYIRSLKRFELKLTDGTTIPVPEKKYTSFRRRLNEYIDNHNDSLHDNNIQDIRG